MRKRTPMTAKVTSPTIRRATIGLALRAPGLRESRRGLIDQVADLYDRAEPGLVSHRTHHQGTNDVAGHGDGEDRQAPPLVVLIERRGAGVTAERFDERDQRCRRVEARLGTAGGRRVV